MAGLIGSIFTSSAITSWYSTLQKPFFNPPNWIFGPVWVTLYTLMGISAFIVFEKGWDKQIVRTALYYFLAQLALNSIWSLIFFGLRLPLIAFAEILVLWAAIAATMLKFLKISRPAFYLLAPYILWLSFAAILNLSIVLLN
jgi:tryptophan-rich sensory protein